VNRYLEIKMSEITPVRSTRLRHLRGGDESLIDYQRRRELEAEERAERRLAQLAEQTLAQNVAGVRIRAWEKVHALRMPSDPDHPILLQIAVATQLTLADIHDEQRVRG
jgi:hypothetical protein